MNLADFDFIYGIALVHISATMSPGPNFAIVSQSAVQWSFGPRTKGVVTGVVLGIFIHCALAGLGLNALLTQYEFVFKCFRILGALFLAYLGIRSFLSFVARCKTFLNDIKAKSHSHSTSVIQSLASDTFKIGFKEGLSGCLLNPKAFLYFASVFPQKLTHKLTFTQGLVTLFILTLITFIWFSLVAIFVAKLNTKYVSMFNLVMSLVISILFISLASSLLFEI